MIYANLFLCIFTFDFCGSQRMQRAVDVLWGPQWALTECIQWGERRQWSHLRFSMEKPIDFWLRKEGVAGSVTPTIDTVSLLRSICRTRLEVVAATGRLSERRSCLVRANERDRKRQTVGKCKRKLPARHESAVSTYLHKQRLYNRCLPVYIHTSVANTMQRYCFLLRYASYIQ